MVGARELAAIARETVVVSGRDPTVLALAGYIDGHVETVVGEVNDGLGRLDRAMSLIMTDAVQPMYAGIIYCGVLWACRQIGDWERAVQWSEVAARWCEREAVVHFPAHLSVHRAELARVQGRFKESEGLALDALDRAGDWSRDLVAWAHHQIGETEGGVEAAGVVRAISMLEHADDVRVSTLRQYLEALGARLELVAVFDDEDRRAPINVGKESAA